MEPRDLALLNARGRMAIGAAMMLAPRLIGPMWVGDAIPRRSRRSVLLIAAASAVSCALLSRALETPPAEHEVFVTEAHLTGHP